MVIPHIGAKWYNLGLQLLDSHTELTNIKDSSAYKDNEDRCREMFSKWIDTDKKASWNKVVSALKSPSVKLISLANDIEKVMDYLIMYTVRSLGRIIQYTCKVLRWKRFIDKYIWQDLGSYHMYSYSLA